MAARALHVDDDQVVADEDGKRAHRLEGGERHGDPRLEVET
jgi:hypothetical protein